MFKRIVLGSLAALLLAACSLSGDTPQPTPIPPTFTPAAPVATEVPAQTVDQAAPTATLPPEETTTPLPQPTATVSPTASLPSSSAGSETTSTATNPLTGLQVSDPSRLARRPVAVKINIVPRYNTRPAWGLSFADIVFDYYHNDGYGRFHATFYGQDAELVGPIRSVRLLDSELIRMYQSIFAYGSADAQINSRFFNSEYSDRLILEGTVSPCPPTAALPLCRYEPAGVDHLLGGTKELSAYMTAKGVANGQQDLSGMSFSDLSPAGGSAGEQVFTRYSGDYYSRWDYDAINHRYLRYQDNVYDTGQGEEYAPLLDRINNQQISADNVVVILVSHVYFAPPPAEIVEILLSGSGKAYAFRDGLVYDLTWNRPSLNSVLSLAFADGTPYPYKPGNTWYQVVGQSSAVTQPAAGAWRFEFKMP